VLIITKRTFNCWSLIAEPDLSRQLGLKFATINK